MAQKNTMVDILVFAPHPDDAELCCGGLLLKARDAGLRLGVIDITRGEMGTRGSVALRKKEADAASKVLGLAVRQNLGLPDGHLQDNQTLRTALVRTLRQYRPQLLLLPHWEDRHPDHAAVGQAGLYAAWLSGATKYDGVSGKNVASIEQLPYRPSQVLHYNNRYGIQADVVIDISAVMLEKLALVSCFSSQFGSGLGTQKQSLKTRLSSENFEEWLRGMHSFYGYQAGVLYGEAYCSKSPLLVKDVTQLLQKAES